MFGVYANGERRMQLCVDDVAALADTESNYVSTTAVFANGGKVYGRAVVKALEHAGFDRVALIETPPYVRTFTIHSVCTLHLQSNDGWGADARRDRAVQWYTSVTRQITKHLTDAQIQLVYKRDDLYTTAEQE